MGCAENWAPLQQEDPQHPMVTELLLQEAPDAEAKGKAKFMCRETAVQGNWV